MEVDRDNLPNEMDADVEQISTEIAQSEEPQDDWQPDYKFKVLDKEHEFDEFIRPVVNKENYDKVKELYEKAYGLDHVKTKYQTTREEYENFKNSQYNPLLQETAQYKQAMQYMGGLIQNQDYANLFRELNIPDDALIQFALDRVNYRDLSPEQKQEYDRNINARNKAITLEMQNEQLIQQQQQFQVQQRQMELQNTLNSDQFRDVAREFDEVYGQQGAFQNAVITTAKYYAKEANVDLSPAEVSNMVAENFKKLRGPAYSNQQVPSQATQGNSVVIKDREPEKSYLPNIKSKGNSPVQALPRSIADIKNIANARRG